MIISVSKKLNSIVGKKNCSKSSGVLTKLISDIYLIIAVYIRQVLIKFDTSMYIHEN